MRTPFTNLKTLEVDEERAWMWAKTRKGYWLTAHGPILLRALLLALFMLSGYLSFTECYLSLNVKTLETPSTERYTRFVGVGYQLMGSLLSDYSRISTNYREKYDLLDMHSLAQASCMYSE